MSAAQVQKLQIKPLSAVEDNVIEKQADLMRKHVLIDSIQNPITDKLLEISKSMDTLLTKKTQDVDQVLRLYRDQLQAFLDVKGRIIGNTIAHLQPVQGPDHDEEPDQTSPTQPTYDPSSDEIALAMAKDQGKHVMNKKREAIGSLLRDNTNVFTVKEGNLQIKMPDYPHKQLSLQTFLDDMLSTRKIKDLDRADLYLRLHQMFPDTFQGYKTTRFETQPVKSAVRSITGDEILPNGRRTRANPVIDATAEDPLLLEGYGKKQRRTWIRFTHY